MPEPGVNSAHSIQIQSPGNVGAIFSTTQRSKDACLTKSILQGLLVSSALTLVSGNLKLHVGF
jgi:hypothetical protein